MKDKRLVQRKPGMEGIRLWKLHDSVLVKFKGHLIIINKHGTKLGWSSSNVTLNSKPGGDL
ncbi:hypothetical protein TorRG33x02_169460 [Trema orientale]|uniref:Bulb-type lectin domain containing protein n=1 Tax=Trema orientale TaxID=63057 RepID=A0A2P5EP36_TREOI|nr:hypothetical protein TorRG33x02_169460 [Trema orientale]